VLCCGKPGSFDRLLFWLTWKLQDEGGRAISMTPTIPGNTEEIGLNGPVPNLPGYHPLKGAYTDRITPKGE
jgi:hypothetical protein